MFILEDRINKVIHTKGFEDVLHKNGLLVLDFQCNWDKFKEFENLPQIYQEAILAGEKEIE